MTARLRDRWVGLRMPHFESDCSPPEKWAVYVFEVPGASRRPTWHVVGRLLQRPWSRVGGGGELALSEGPFSAEAREWVARHAPPPGQMVWFPMGSLLRPHEVTVRDLAPYRERWGAAWSVKHTFDSLGGARESARRMAAVICPRDTQHRSWS